VLEEYINQLVSKDVDGCVASMPQEFITMIAKQMSCDDSVAREVARDMVEKLFYTKEILYRDIEELWAEQPHKVTIERIDVYPKKDVLFEIYQGYDVVLVDAINIDYKVTLNETEDEAENETENEINKYDRVRFVKMENGEWELDLSFVENHES